ncbi:MAG TPA: transposase [Nitrospiria bacterium]|nr:transposase [Nitrospiria bacterium]
MVRAFLLAVMPFRFNSDIHHRRSIRLAAYDYSKAGAYYVTVCSQDRECLFGSAVGGETKLNEPGRMVERWWLKLNAKFENVETDAYVVMPNHFHGIIIINNPALCVGAAPCGRPNQSAGKGHPHGGAPTLGNIMDWFKTMTTNEYIRRIKSNNWPPFNKRLWQRNYYEHVIRSETELGKIREYIEGNPAQWNEDEYHPEQII